VRGEICRPLGVCDRDGGRYREKPCVEDWAVDAEDVTGDHGLDEAMELRDTLLL